MPTLLRLPALGLTVAAYTDGFDHYLADGELLEIAAAGRDVFPRVTPRRAGGWQVPADPANQSARPVVLARAVISGRLHHMTGPAWPWPAAAPAGNRRWDRWDTGQCRG